LIAGILGGWIAGQLTHGQGYGCFGNPVLGLAGAILGGFLFSRANVEGTAGLLASTITATIGAVALLTVANLIRQ
jgi:uncharacterized membrane protein YeaQ/YmgE (transglycosylase-associated protein family)